MKVDLYSVKAVKGATVELPKEWEAKENLALLSQAIHVYRAKSHFGLSKAKSRGEITMSTRKIYKQKGTGGARHGAKSAPIFVGGGVAHGPKTTKVRLTLTTSMKKKAFAVAMSVKVAEGMVFAVNGLSEIQKTKEANTLAKALMPKDQKGRVTFVLTENSAGATRAFKNIENTVVKSVKNLNVFDVFFGGTIIIDSSVFEKVAKVKVEAKRAMKVATVKKATKPKEVKK